MRLSGGHALRAQQTAATMVTPFQAKTNFLTLRFFYPAALGAQKTARTASPSLGDVNVEGLDPKGAAQTGRIGTRLGWSNQLPVCVSGCLHFLGYRKIRMRRSNRSRFHIRYKVGLKPRSDRQHNASTPRF